MEPFLLRALVAGVGVAIVAAPLGCFVVWQRMAYFGETMAQASLIGIALGLLLQLDLTVAALVTALAVAGLLMALSRQKLVPLDSILGLLAHAALAVGIISASLVKGPSIDLMGYLFGDIFVTSRQDLVWIGIGGLIVLIILARIWQPLLALSIHEELASAEGVNRDIVKGTFVALLALTIAVAMKIVGILLVIAFLIMPAAAARPLSSTPEQMAMISIGIAIAGVLGGIGFSVRFDVPGGPAIVLVLALIAAVSLSSTAIASVRR